MGWLLFFVVGLVMIYHYLNRFHGFDPFRRSPAARPARRKSSLPVDAESQYLLCTFSIAAKVIAADGKIAEEERDKLGAFMEKELELSEKEKQLAWKIFDNALEDELEIRDYAKAFRKYFPDRVQLTDKVITTLLGLAASDGYVHPREDQAIRSTALLLDISEPAYDLLKSEQLSDEERFH